MEIDTYWVLSILSQVSAECLGFTYNNFMQADYSYIHNSFTRKVLKMGNTFWGAVTVVYVGLPIVLWDTVLTCYETPQSVLQLLHRVFCHTFMSVYITPTW